MPNNLNETAFEEHIAIYWAGSYLYEQRTPSNFDITNLMDRTMFERFLKVQPIAWSMLTANYPE